MQVWRALERLEPHFRDIRNTFTRRKSRIHVYNGTPLKALTLARINQDQHQIIMGDTGTRKSSLIRQNLIYARAKNMAAIVHDPEREFLKEFYRPGIDIIINPKDRRGWGWELATEGVDEPTHLTVAKSLLPEPPTKSASSDIFYKWTHNLYAFLMSQYRPSTEEFAEWLCRFDKHIYPKIFGTEHWDTLSRNSADQRAGIIGTLATIGLPLRMLPTRSEQPNYFSAREYTKAPGGRWVFFTSTSDTRDSIRLIHSAIMDLIINGLMINEPKENCMLVYDELHTLGPLPRLHDGVTMMRKHGHQILICILNQEQIARLYGQQERTIFSMARTKWVFPTSDPTSAKALAALAGQQDRIYVRETFSEGGGKLGNRKSLQLDRKQNVDLIMPSQIQGGDDGRAFFLQRGVGVKGNANSDGDLVAVPVTIPYIELPKVEPGLVDRVIPPRAIKLTEEEQQALDQFLASLNPINRKPLQQESESEKTPKQNGQGKKKLPPATQPAAQGEAHV